MRTSSAYITIIVILGEVDCIMQIYAFRHVNLDKLVMLWFKKFHLWLNHFFLRDFKVKNHRPNPTYRLKKKNKHFLNVQKTSFGCRVKGKPLFCHCPPAERLKNFFCILPYSFYVHVINSHVHPFPNEIYTPCSTPLFPSFFFFLAIISWNSSHFSTFISAHYYSFWFYHMDVSKFI